MSKIINVKLDNGECAYIEIDNDNIYEEAGIKESIYDSSSDYIKVASNVINNLKKLDLSPDSIELSFSIKLAITAGKAVSWIIADGGVETNLGIKMKWKKND